MSKKLDFLRDEQSRQQHPERQQVGSPSAEAGGPTGKGIADDRQEPHTGKVANDHNKTGHQEPTQTNQARRTPESRNDRQAIGAGPQNQSAARRGGGGAGRAPHGGS